MVCLFPAIFTSIESPFNLFPKWSDIVIPKGYLVRTSGVSTISTCREKIFPSHMALNDGYKSLGCSTIFTPISTNIASSDSTVEISGFFYHSDFPWNQFRRIWKCKICHCNTFRGSEFWFLWIFVPLEDHFWPNIKIQNF